MPRAQRDRGLEQERERWTVVAVLAITETVSWGVLYYAYSVFITPMEREFGWTRSQTTGAYSLALLAAALGAVPIGRWLDAHGPRVLMTLASLAGSVLLVLWSGVNDILALYLIWVGIGLVMAGLLYEAAFTVVTKWFVVRRRTALTAVTLVAGFASFIFLPLANALIERYGWRPALLILAAIFAGITVPLHAIFLRSAPPPAASSPEVASEAVEIAIRPRAAMRSATFWLLASSFAVSSFTTAALSVHLVPYLEGDGYPSAFAALSAGLLGAMQVPGRVIFATVLRFLPRSAEPIVAFALQGVGVLLLGVASGGAGVLVAVLLFGVGNGMATLIRALAFSEAFGARWYGSVAGMAGAVAVGARAVAPLSTALLFGFVGDYRPVFLVLAGGSVLAALAAGRAYTRPDRARLPNVTQGS